jgi:hypothetical protein
VPLFYEEEFTGVLELLDREGAPSYSAADIEEPTELALVWEAELTSWVVEGEAAECRLNEKRAKVVRALAEAGGPVSPRQVTDAVEAGYEATRQRLYQMSRSGEILAVGRGRYTIPHRPNNANNDPAANGGDVREVRMVRGARATYPPTPPMLGMLETLGGTPTTFHSTTSPTGCSKRGTRTTTLVTNTVMVMTMVRIIHPIVDAMNACRSRRSSCVPQRIPEGLSRCLVPQPHEGAKTSCDSLPPNVS